MMKISKLIAKSRLFTSANAVFCSVFLWGCSALPTPPASAALYDLGGVAPVEAPTRTAPGVRQSVIAITPAVSNGLLDTSTMMYYRLAYAGGQQLRPYAYARWSQPPATLVQQRLRHQLGLQWVVLDTADGVVLSAKQTEMAGQPPAQQASLQSQSASATDFTVGGGMAWGSGSQSMRANSAAAPTQLWVLQVELEAFNQVFVEPATSSGVVRWRATVFRPHDAGAQLVGQQVFTAQAPAPTADAAGGATALAQATDDAAKALDEWLTSLQEQAAAQPQ